MTTKPIEITASMSNEDELRARFRLVCKACGSEDVAIDLDPGRTYSKHTRDSSSVRIGCNGCGVNDFFAML